MNTQTQEALKMAIEALSQDEGWFEPEAAIQACKEALEQSRLDEMQSITEKEYRKPAQEPVAWQWLKSGHIRKKIPKTATPEHWRPLYSHPAPSWQGLSNNKITSLFAFYGADTEEAMIDFARAIEQALKEKNT